jgi:uncharacterized protein YukE
MTALARSLQAQAATIADLGSHAQSRYRTSEFQGPAATRVAGRVDQVASGATALANRLSDFAATVARAAADLAAQVVDEIAELEPGCNEDQRRPFRAHCKANDANPRKEPV